MEILSVPVALEKERIGKEGGLTKKQFDVYKHAFSVFYELKPEFVDDVYDALRDVRISMEEMPEGSDARMELAIKRYQLAAMATVAANNERKEQLKKSTDPAERSDLLNGIGMSESGLRGFREQTMQKYKIELPAL